MTFCVPVGTGGTLTGGAILKQHIPGLKVVAVEPAGSRCCPGAEPDRIKSGHRRGVCARGDGHRGDGRGHRHADDDAMAMGRLLIHWRAYRPAFPPGGAGGSRAAGPAARERQQTHRGPLAGQRRPVSVHADVCRCVTCCILTGRALPASAMTVSTRGRYALRVMVELSLQPRDTFTAAHHCTARTSPSNIWKPL